MNLFEVILTSGSLRKAININNALETLRIRCPSYIVSHSRGQILISLICLCGSWDLRFLWAAGFQIETLVWGCSSYKAYCSGPNYLGKWTLSSCLPHSHYIVIAGCRIDHLLLQLICNLAIADKHQLCFSWLYCNSASERFCSILFPSKLSVGLEIFPRKWC